MCYIIARKYKKIGCIALKYEHGDTLINLEEYLTIRVIERDIEIIIIGDNYYIYGEYKPYTFVDSEIEFINRVLLM